MNGGLPTTNSLDNIIQNSETTCPHCGLPLKTIRIEVFGVTREVPCYGSCGCEESQLQYQSSPKPSDRIRRYAQAGIPSRYRILEEPTKTTTEHVRSIAAGKNVYIHGVNGDGKTALACAIAKGLLDEGVRVRYQSLAGLRQGWFDSEDSKLSCRVPVLVLDDIGKDISDFWGQCLFYLIDERYTAELPTIFTSNFSIGELGKQLATKCERTLAQGIISRLSENTEIVQLEEVDYRAMVG